MQRQYGSAMYTKHIEFPDIEVFEKYAWFPVETSSEKWVWFDTYYRIHTYYDASGKPPLTAIYWKQVLNKKEYLIWQLKRK